MTTQHTPGPWNAFAGAVFTGTREEPTFIARIAKGKNLGRTIKCWETKWMNQQLIAAAPDMLAALQIMDGLHMPRTELSYLYPSLLVVRDFNGEELPLRVIIDRAIAKATGGDA